MKKFVPGKGFVQTPTIPHSRPVRSVPSIKGPKLAKKASGKKARKS